MWISMPQAADLARESAQVLPVPAPIVVTSADGLRLYLRPEQAQLILVETGTGASA
jgi:hypothetical protein